jgi:hypothetical protein
VEVALAKPNSVANDYLSPEAHAGE